ncbi:DUF192 domain-containing protein [Selenomonas caprae]|uniref:DUF192 domain-containing protein n=1 Tax=Selenomonas caprae TaxID=2606905 RepID=A0A5D6WMB1_9FIRM|nr:DUF192 domain-containing protein [Selenomonas caprae]TYZ29256.1 DUF192 domain-containing protein [Selenomonas caprae]
MEIDVGGKKDVQLRLEIADSFWQRFLGLMGRKKLARGTGLLLAPCNSIHMCFMRFSIDAVYIDKEYRVLKVVRDLRPWIGISWCPKAWAVIEMNAGEVARYGLEKDMILHTKKVTDWP